jgi:biopolymer transport protein ExbD
MHVRHQGLIFTVCAVWLAALCTTGASCASAASPDDGQPITKGGVRLYVKQKRIEMDGKFSLAEGPIEVLVCAKGGKEYESVISVDANPEILHFCLLLLKLKPGATGPKFQGDPDRAPTGSPVDVTVRWKDANGVKTVRGEQLCWNAIDKRPMLKTPWVFVGSKKQKDPDTGRTVYWANVEKSLITVFRDPFAVLDLPLLLGANDDAYVVNKQLVPKPGTPCTVILTPAKPIKFRKNAGGGRIILIDVTAGGRVLIDGMQPKDLAEALKKTAAAFPKGTVEISIDHGPAMPAAAALEALSAAGIQVESVATVRPQPGVKDEMTVAVSADGARVNGKKVSAEQLTALVRKTARPEKPAGIHVAVQKDVPLKAAAQVVRGCAGVEGVLVRVTWAGKAPAAQ